MATHIFEPHGTLEAWSASGTISRELAPKPYTITRMAIVVRNIMTTTSATWYNDGFDRLITRMNLSGNAKTYFDFSNMRAAYHLSRFGGFGPKRPTFVADSITTGDQYFAYIFHFGVAPFRVNPVTQMLEDNPYDLTAGIPPTGSGNLTLGGAFGANSVAGSSVTITDGDLEIYFWGVLPEDGDSPAAYMPRAVPVWSMRTPTPTATSTAFGTEDNIPTGDFLHSMLVMVTNGSNAPRDDSVLNSLELINAKKNNTIFRYGGWAGAVVDFKGAEILSQFGSRLHLGYCPTDNVTTAMDAIASGGSPASLAVPPLASDSGLIYVPIHQFTAAKNPGLGNLYGADLRGAATGDLKLKYGVSDATGVTMDVVYRRYQLNPAHPLNAGL